MDYSSPARMTPIRSPASGLHTPFSRASVNPNSTLGVTHAELELELVAHCRSLSSTAMTAAIKTLLRQAEYLNISLPPSDRLTTLDTEVRTSYIGSLLISLLTQIFQQDPMWSKTLTTDFPLAATLAKYQVEYQNTAVRKSMLTDAVHRSPAQYKVSAARQKERIDMECNQEIDDIHRRSDALRADAAMNTEHFLVQVMGNFYPDQYGYLSPTLRLPLPQEGSLLSDEIRNELERQYDLVHTAAMTPSQQANAAKARVDLLKLEAQHRSVLERVEQFGNYNFFTLLNGTPFTPPYSVPPAGDGSRRALRSSAETKTDSPQQEYVEVPDHHSRQLAADAAYAEEKAALIRRVKMKHETRFIVLLAQEDDAAQTLAENEASIREATTTMEGLQNMMDFLAALQRMNLSVVHKLQRCIEPETAIVQVLNSTFVHSFTGVTQSKALAENNLCWVWDLLQQQFKVPKVHIMFQSLLEIFSETADPTLDFVSLMSSVDNRLSTWRSLDYWQFMTPDIFFSCITIIRVKKASLRAELLKLLTEAIAAPHEQVDIAIGAPTLHDPMPIYARINQKLRAEVQAATFNHRQTEPRPRDQGRYGGRNSRGNRDSRPHQDPPPPPGHEQAHLAEVPGDVTVLSAQAGTLPTNKKFVTVDDKLWYQYALRSGEVAHASYTATSEVCNKCYPRGAYQKANSSSPHQPHCFGGKCSNCSLYGHSVCFQKTKKPSNLTALKAAADGAKDT